MEFKIFLAILAVVAAKPVEHPLEEGPGSHVHSQPTAEIVASHYNVGLYSSQSVRIPIVLKDQKGTDFHNPRIVPNPSFTVIQIPIRRHQGEASAPSVPGLNDSNVVGPSHATLIVPTRALSKARQSSLLNLLATLINVIF